VLASAIPGRPLNRVFYTGIWRPIWAGPRRIDTQFHTLGQLLATLHEHAVVPAGAPGATTTPFDTVKALLASARGDDAMIPVIEAW
jgi:type II secretory pathway component PulM